MPAVSVRVTAASLSPSLEKKKPLCQARPPSMRAAILGLLLGLAISGCGRIERTRQCRHVVATVNDALEQISTRWDAGADSVETTRELAKRYAELAAALELELENPGLEKAVSEYRDLIGETSKALERAADARERNDLRTLAAVKRELASSQRREKGLVMRIDAACESP